MVRNLCVYWHLTCRVTLLTICLSALLYHCLSLLKISAKLCWLDMGDRGLIIGQIHEVRRNFLNEYGSSTPIPPIRILGDTSNSILNHSKFLESIKTIIEEVENTVATCRPDAKIRWIAVNKFEGRHSFFVLDLNNVEYDYESAHKCLSKVRVYVLQLSRAPKLFRCKPQGQKLAEKLAQTQNLHGKDPLPLFDDHTRPRIYGSSRHQRLWYISSCSLRINAWEGWLSLKKSSPHIYAVDSFRGNHSNIDHKSILKPIFDTFALILPA